MTSDTNSILKRISNIVWHIDTNRWVGDTVTLDEVHKSLQNILRDFEYKNK